MFNAKSTLCFYLRVLVMTDAALFNASKAGELSINVINITKGVYVQPLRPPSKAGWQYHTHKQSPPQLDSMPSTTGTSERFVLAAPDP